jgi:FMN phosphatase YigB (HAD superfamily)
LNTFIFDLDGTLLPMPSQEAFLDTYFKAISMKMIPHGLDPQFLMKTIWAGTRAMMDNDGTMTNEQRFWEVYCQVMGPDAREQETIFEEFYRNEFVLAKSTTFTHPHAKECIRLLKEKGYQIALATNPIFPRIATLTRMEWAGINPDDFALITTYENSSYSKPNLKYYEEIVTQLGKLPSDCIMIGNDVKEDMCAGILGMDTFLLTDCLICTDETNYKHMKQGNFDDLLYFIQQLPVIV